MRTGSIYSILLVLSCSSSTFILLAAAAPSTGSASTLLTRDDSDPSTVDPPAAADDAPFVPDTTYLPAQIGGIVGSYAVSLVLVAIGLLALSKRRRDHLRAGEDGLEAPILQFQYPDVYPEHFLKGAEFPQFPYAPAPELGLAQPGQTYPETAAEGYPAEYPAEYPSDYNSQFAYPPATPRSPHPNFSYPASPTRSEAVYSFPSPTSTVRGPGFDLAVDQNVVARDRAMAQNQLEDMYKLVMEQEAAKEEGREPNFPPTLLQTPRPRTAGTGAAPPSAGLLKKERVKPATLDLNREEKTQSRTSSLLSILKSPRKSKAPPPMNISSPIMTPMSATFPREMGQEMSSIPPRSYAPPPPPPVPTDQLPYMQRRNTGGSNNGSVAVLPLTPDMSPQSTMSIDERIAAIGAPPLPRAMRGQQRETREDRGPSHTRDPSTTTTASRTTDGEPASAISEKSSSPLVGLPSSPKPGVNRFPSLDSLPSSPKPGSTFSGSTFSRANAPSAVRTGGSLPLRAYEPSLASPSITSQQTKQTVFTRAGPLSPGGGRTPFTPYTGAAVPYSPYQPFSPVVPMTPSLVTRADRKRMKRLEPKTPTVEMVRSQDDVW